VTGVEQMSSTSLLLLDEESNKLEAMVYVAYKMRLVVAAKYIFSHLTLN
jgi:hypothetical protein